MFTPFYRFVIVQRSAKALVTKNMGNNIQVSQEKKEASNLPLMLRDASLKVRIHIYEDSKRNVTTFNFSQGEEEGNGRAF